MKRANSEEDLEPLGASEFAGILNGDDPQAIFRSLKRFVRTVRRERAMALSNLEQDDETSDEEGTPQDYERPKKLRKDESWKEDKADYNVPFVGTSFAKGDSGQVVVGEWPTGLLKAYIERSPLAVELTSDQLVPGIGRVHKMLLKNKQGRLSQAVYKVYLRALIELVSAAIPKEKMNLEADDEEGNGNHQLSQDNFRFVGELMKKRFTAMIALLKEETGNGKGKATIIGGCGQLAPLVLQLLTHLAMTNSTTARHIARSLEQDLPEGVLRFLLRPQNRRSTTTTTPRDKARIAAIHLARVLLEQNDGIVLSCICTPGIKERKIHAGILFLSLREGLSEVFTTQVTKDDTHLASLLFASSRLLQALRRVLLSNNPISKRSALDILSRDAMDHLCEATSRAPLLSENNGFREVLASTDNISDEDSLAFACVTARRLLFFLLAVETSPLLLALREKSRSSNNCRILILRSLSHLSENVRGLGIQNFVVHCIQSTPSLLPGFFKALNVPDPKSVFPFIARINLISKVMKICPSTNSTLLSPTLSDGMLVDFIVPVGLKQPLTKALQGKNEFVVTHALGLLAHILRRFKKLVDRLKPVDSSALIPAVAMLLPDIQIVLSIFSRFSIEFGKENEIVVFHALLVLEGFVDSFPFEVSASKFDWTRMFPRNVSIFCRSSNVLQWRVLRTYSSVVDKVRSVPVSTFRVLSAIALQTRDPKCLIISREIFAKCFCRAMGSCGSEGFSPLKFEGKCWLDGLTDNTIDEFNQNLVEAIDDSLTNFVTLAKCWKISGLSGNSPPDFTSNLMVHTVNHLQNHSSSFVSLICEVLVRCLVSSTNPLSLAALVNVSSLSWNVYDSLSDITRYCDCLIRFEDYSTVDIRSRYEAMVRSKLPSLVHVTVDESRRFDPAVTVLDKYLNFSVEESESRQLQMNHKILVDSSKSTTEVNVKEYRIFSILSMSSATESYLKSESISFLMIVPRRSAEVLLLVRCLFGDNSGFRMLVLRDDEKELATDDTPSGRKAYLHALFLAPLIPADLQISILTGVLAGGRCADRPTSCVVGRIYLKLIEPKLKEDGITSIQLAEDLSRSWLLLSLQEDLDVALKDFLLEIERFLEAIIVGENASMTIAVLKEIARFSPKQVLELCIQNIASNLESGRMKSDEMLDGFLSNLIMSDWSHYYQAWSHLLASKLFDENTQRVFEEGYVDGVLIKILGCQESGVSASRDCVIEKAVSRVLICLAKGEWSQGRSRELVIALVPHVRSMSNTVPDGVISSMVTAVISEYLQSPEDLPLFQLAVVSLKCISITAISSAKQKMTDAIEAMLLLLPKRLKNPSDGDFYYNESYQHLSLTIDIIRQLTAYDFLNLEINRNVIMKALKACIKHAFSSLPQNHVSLQRSCLHLTSLVVSSLFFTGVPEKSDTQDGMVLHVFKMIVSHSRFPELMTTGDKTSESIRCDIAVLMLKCLRIESVVPFEIDIWRLILASYNASTSFLDETLRQVMELYIENYNNMVPLEIFRWGREHAAVGSSIWDWLPSAISISRVNATIRDFPVEDKPFPRCRREVAALDEVSNSHTSKNSKVDESRYSPGFLLRLILGTLKTHQTISSDYDKEDRRQEHTAHLAQRLSDSGCLALAICALSSYSETLRKIALCILFHFKGIMDSKEAHHLSSWKDRPQLLLILNSVLRALLPYLGEQRSEIQMNVLRLPMPASIYLSKAAIILSHPGHPLFGPINRYFLRIEEAHGAFQDIFRLPAFISLFCSPAEDPTQAEKEKCWAIELLRDCAKDEESYKSIVGCHSLDLILSSLEISSCIHAEDNLEPCFAFEVLINFISTTGAKGPSLLIGRMGLLAWIRSFAARHLAESSTLLRSQKVLLLFLKFVTATVASYRQVPHSPDLISALADLLHPMLQIYMKASIPKTDESANGGILELLEEFRISLGGYTGLSNQTNIKYSGVSPSDIFNFLDFWHDASTIGRVTHCLCSFPISVENESPGLLSLSIKLLRIISSRENHNNELYAVVLNRLVTWPTPSYDTDQVEQAISLLFDARHQCSLEPGLRNIWFKFLADIARPNDNKDNSLHLPNLAAELIDVNNQYHRV